MPDAPIILGYDPDTLRERIDVAAAEERLAQIAHLRSLAATNERVALLRMLGRLDEALEAAQDAYRQSRFTGAREDALAARVRRAVVHQYQGKAETALRELDGCVDEARTHEWTALAAFALQHRGKTRFDLGELELALADFEEALRLRTEAGAQADQIESSKFAVRVTRDRLRGDESADDFTEPITSQDL